MRVIRGAVLLYGSLVAMVVTGMCVTKAQTVDSIRELPECPHYGGAWLKSYRNDSGGAWLKSYRNDSSMSAPLLSVPDSLSGVPEYHDCQRLLVPANVGVSNSVRIRHNSYHTRDTLAFGPLAAVYVRYHLDSVYEHSPLVPATLPGQWATLIRNPPTDLRLAISGEVASLGDYRALGIRRGFNCVVVGWRDSVDGHSSPKYMAWMVYVGTRDKCNPDPSHPFDPFALKIVTVRPLFADSLPTEGDAAGIDSVPTVARWDWDSVASQQYIGLKCPKHWCELHSSPRYASSPTYVPPASLGLHGTERSVVRQKGWYDAEYLTKVRKGTVIPLAIDGTWGSIFPVPGLGDRKMTDYGSGTWLPAAWVSITPASPGYLTKYNYDGDGAPPSRSGRNTVSLCFAAASNPTACIPAGLPGTCTSDNGTSTTQGGLWYAKVEGAEHKGPTYMCVSYISTPSTKVHPPGNVRWRWVREDQTIWISCPAGCCQVKAPK